jgi:hypothetical protein
MISHLNVISNVLQIKTFESPCRDARPPEEKTEVGLGLLPLSHIYGLVVIASASSYRGDEVVVLPKFELQSFLDAIQTRKIRTLYLVSYLSLISLVCTNFLSGSAHHHPNGKKLPGMLKIRSQQCDDDLYWSCASWCRNRRGSSETLSILDDTSGLWYACNRPLNI